MTLRIAVVTETFPPEVNGVAMTTRRMVEGLLDRGHQLQLVRPRQHVRDQPAQRVGLSELLVPGLALPRYRGLRVGLPVVRTLQRAWQAWRPDAVQVVTEGPLGWAALTAAQRLRLPIASEFHTNFHTYTQHYGLGLLRGPIGGYLRRFHNRSCVTFVPTRELKASLEADGYRDLRVVARGVDTYLFDPRWRSLGLRESWGVGADAQVVLHVGRIAPEKNLPLVFSTFERMRQHSRSARLVLVGDGPSLAQLARAHPQHVFAGMRTGEDLAAHYASADLFLFPSLTETFGNVTIEAMASGLAVAAFDYAAAREHIVHGENGLLAALGDERAFERIGVQLAGDPAQVERLRQNARITAERISWNRVVR